MARVNGRASVEIKLKNRGLQAGHTGVMRTNDVRNDASLSHEQVSRLCACHGKDTTLAYSPEGTRVDANEASPDLADTLT